MITIDDFKKVEIRAGRVLSAERIEGSEKLLKLRVDFGFVDQTANEKDVRQVISGIAKFVSPEDLTDKTVAFVTNLEPREIMGQKSEAMILAVSGEDVTLAKNFFSLMYLQDVPPGSLVK